MSPGVAAIVPIRFNTSPGIAIPLSVIETAFEISTALSPARSCASTLKTFPFRPSALSVNDPKISAAQKIRTISSHIIYLRDRHITAYSGRSTSYNGISDFMLNPRFTLTINPSIRKSLTVNLNIGLHSECLSNSAPSYSPDDLIKPEINVLVLDLRDCIEIIAADIQ